MPYVTVKQLYDLLPAGRPMAIGAFNVHNMEYTQAVVQAAETTQMPVILMLGEPMLAYADLEMLAVIAKNAAQRSSIPIAVALDHGKTWSIIRRCIELGLSVMVDGSALPYEENVQMTQTTVQLARRYGVSVEGELGSLAGIEDVEDEATELLTDPTAAAEFAERTGVDGLAVAIGNCHGKYLRPPVLDMERLRSIHRLVDVPIVLHGGSDLPVDMSRQAIENGIRKFNEGTDLKYAFCEEMRRLLNEDPMPFQPPQTLGVARDAVYRTACDKIRLFQNGCTLQL